MNRTTRNRNFKQKKSQKSKDHSRLWLFGIHAVSAALINPARCKFRLIATRNSATRLNDEIKLSGMDVEYADARKFPAPFSAETVHQGVALETSPLKWPDLKTICQTVDHSARIVILDRVNDPHNVGAVLRSALAFGAKAVIAPARHAPKETGALAKSASGALEQVPYLRVNNLAAAMTELRNQSFTTIGFDVSGMQITSDARRDLQNAQIALVFGSESAGIRNLTRKKCDWMFSLCDGSLNVSNATAIALYAFRVN